MGLSEFVSIRYHELALTSCREGGRSADVLDALNVESNLFFGLVNVRVSIYFKPIDVIVEIN